MAASRTDILRWLADLYADDDRTHMIVKCDSFDAPNCCYPVYVTKGEKVREVDAANGDRTMEVYSANLTVAEQMGQARARNYD